VRETGAAGANAPSHAEAALNGPPPCKRRGLNEKQTPRGPPATRGGLASTPSLIAAHGESLAKTNGLPGRQHGGDAFPLLAGRRFDLAHVFEAVDHLFDDPLSLFNVGQLAAAEDHGDNDLVFVHQEFAGVIDFDFNVMLARLRTNANFLQLRLMRVRFVLPLLLLLLELAEIHDSADGRALVRRHFHQIQLGLAGSS
jgi:hypothetical protein